MVDAQHAMAQKAPSNSHVSYLDSIRGLAALAVICCHYVESHDLPCRGMFCDYVLSATLLHLWWDGQAAVTLFFVLSGLVLSLRYFQQAHPPSLSAASLARYVISRIFRIWPPYLVVLGISAAAYDHYQIMALSLPDTVPKQNDWIPYLWSQPYGWPIVLKDSFLLGNALDMTYLPQAWTLSIELTLSLFVPVGAWLAYRSSLALLATVSIAVLGLGFSPFIVHFMLGILVAKHYPTISPRLSAALFYRRCILAMGVILFAMGASLGGVVGKGWLSYGIGIGASLLLLAAFSSARMQKILLLPWLRHIGKVSYSIYLLHFLILINLTPWFLAWVNNRLDGFYWNWWLGLGMNIVVSILIASLSYRWLELPSIALGAKIKSYW